MSGHILKGIVAIAYGDFAAAMEVVAGIDANPAELDAETAEAMFGDGAADALARLSEIGLSFIVLDEGREIEAVRRLLCAEEPIEAGVIQALEPSFHYASGDPQHQPYQGEISVSSQVDHNLGVVAMVDTGIVDQGNRPDWLGDVMGDPDGGQVPPSHGTFVASIIRQLAPQYPISVKVSGVVPVDKFHDVADTPQRLRKLTSEWHVADAILRLVDEHANDEQPPVALNISMGGPLADGADDMLVLRYAVARWYQAFPDSPVVASAGNADNQHLIYPAALSGVISVGAADGDGNEIVWDQNDQLLRTSDIPLQRSWVGELAPGLDIAGCSGAGREDFICWGGSSAAAAVALGARLQGRQPTVKGRFYYWSPTDIDGLTTCDEEGGTKAPKSSD